MLILKEDLFFIKILSNHSFGTSLLKVGFFQVGLFSWRLFISDLVVNISNLVVLIKFLRKALIFRVRQGFAIFIYQFLWSKETCIGNVLRKIIIVVMGCLATFNWTFGTLYWNIIEWIHWVWLIDKLFFKREFTLIFNVIVAFRKRELMLLIIYAILWLCLLINIIIITSLIV